MRFTYLAAFMFLWQNACGSNSALDPISVLCASFSHSFFSPCPEPYQTIDAKQAALICNDANAVTTTLTSTCEQSSTISGTWVPGKVNAKHLTAKFNCLGKQDHPNPNVWWCQTETATLTFADNSTMTFLASGNDPHVEIDSCSPARYSASMVSADSWNASLSLQVPKMAQGSFPVQNPNATAQDENVVSVDFLIAPPTAKFYAPGTFGSGTLSFTKASLDPNFDLAFTIDADAVEPTSDVQEEYAIYCSSNELHSSIWLNFHPSANP